MCGYKVYISSKFLHDHKTSYKNNATIHAKAINSTTYTTIENTENERADKSYTHTHNNDCVGAGEDKEAP